MLTLELHNINIYLKFDNENERTRQWVLGLVHNALDPLDPNRYHKKAFLLRGKDGERLWDGRVKLCSLKKEPYTAPIGLYDDLLLTLGKNDIEYSVKDIRPPKLAAKIPDNVFLDGQGKEKDITLRDYQYNGLVQAFKNQEGILLNATNAGKTAISVALCYYLINNIPNDKRILFIAPNSSIMNQVFAKYQHYLGEDLIGIWGDGKKDLNKPIVCATIQSIYSGIKKPKVKLTRKKDKLLERLSERYRPAVLSGGNYKANLNLLARNYHPKYKYEQDDVDYLRQLAMDLQTPDQVEDYFKGIKKRYDKTLYKLDKKKFDKYNSSIDFLHTVVAVICDEAQYAGANSYWEVFQHLINARMRIGMTGTLDKSQKLKMARIKSLLGKPISKVTNKQMIDRGVSAKPHIKLVPINQPADLDTQVGAIMQKMGNVKGAADLVQYQIAYKLGVVENDYRNQLIAKLAYASAKQLHKEAVLIIVNSIHHGELITDELDKLGATYEFIQGKDDTEVREDVFDKVRSGELKILIGTKILDAGIDIDTFKVFIECSGGKSYITLLQRIGRMLRVNKHKHDIYIFDIYDEMNSILWSHAKKRVNYYKEEGFDVK